MIIQKVDPDREAFSDYTLEETILTIGGIAVDLEAEQGSQEAIIAFSNHDGVVRRGLMPCCEYVAEVIIPPRRYETVEVEGPPVDAFSGNDNGNGKGGKKKEVPATHLETVPVPLDMDSVILKLWPAEHDRHEEAIMAGGEENV
jgi:hypothetical protein